MVTSIIVSLVPFQTLIYIFPTLLFFISLIARLILTFTTKNDIMKELFKYTQETTTSVLKNITNEANLDVSKILQEVVAKAITLKQMPPLNPDTSNDNILINQERKKRNSHFLYGLIIDSLALSIANGVIIMFEAQNLFYGFILLFVGVVLCSLGFTALYADRQGLATFIALLITGVLFLSELLYLLTSDVSWFYKIPEYFFIVTLILIVIVAFHEFRKKRKQKRNSPNTQS